jgi:diphthine synthase
MLYLIGLGLVDDDITVKGLEAMKKADLVCCELYTNNWMGDLKKLEQKTEKKIRILNREEVESDFLVAEAGKKDVALLVSGDPLAATTHFELVFQAKERGIACEVFHAPSIYTSVSETGLQLYKFGRATTIAYPEKDYFPMSPYDIIERNKNMGMHTLVLLDIKPERQMTVKDGIELLLKMEQNRKKQILSESGRLVACCRIGGSERKIKYAPASELQEDAELAKTPAIIIVPGELNFKEEEALELWK